MIQIAETEIAAAAIKYLQQFDWDVYQEVVAPGGRIDIVARRGGTIWAIEAKRSMGLAVLEQASQWRGHANYVSVVVAGRVSKFVIDVCTTLGIGIMAFNGERCRVIIDPALARKRSGAIERHLREEQKDWAPAGSQGGRYYTPFQAVARILEDLVRAAGAEGMDLKRLMESVDSGFRHHYGQAPVKRNLVRWFERGYIKNVKLTREGKIVRLTWHDPRTPLVP